MPNQVCNNAVIRCTMCAAPGVLSVLPIHRVKTFTQPAANINDHVPMVNIKPFGPCMAPGNPATAAATAAALGVLTPGPCMPNTPSPWASGSPTVKVDFLPALNKSSMLTCMAGGVISIQFEGQATHAIP